MRVDGSKAVRFDRDEVCWFVIARNDCIEVVDHESGLLALDSQGSLCLAVQQQVESSLNPTTTAVMGR